MYCLVLKQPAVQFCSDHSAIYICCPNRWLSMANIAPSVPLKYIIGGIQQQVTVHLVCTIIFLHLASIQARLSSHKVWQYWMKLDECIVFATSTFGMGSTFCRSQDQKVGWFN